MDITANVKLELSDATWKKIHASRERVEASIKNGEKVIQMGVVDALERKSGQEIQYRVVVKDTFEESEEDPEQVEPEEQTIEEPEAESEESRDPPTVISTPAAITASVAEVNFYI